MPRRAPRPRWNAPARRAADADPEAADHDKIEKQRKVLCTYCALKRRGLLRGFGYCANTLLNEASYPVLSVIALAPFSVDKGDAGKTANKPRSEIGHGR